MKWVIALVIFCSLLGAGAQIYLKKGMTDFEFAYEQIIRNWELVLGVFLYGLSFILYNFALKFGEVTMLYPLIAFSYIWVMILASFMLNEPVTMKKIVGAVVIVGGVFLIGGS